MCVGAEGITRRPTVGRAKLKCGHQGVKPILDAGRSPGDGDINSANPHTHLEERGRWHLRNACHTQLVRVRIKEG